MSRRDFLIGLTASVIAPSPQAYAIDWSNIAAMQWPRWNEAVRRANNFRRSRHD